MVSPRKLYPFIKLPKRLPHNLMERTNKSCESLFSTSSKESASLIYQAKLGKTLHRRSSHHRNDAQQQNQSSTAEPPSIIQQRVMSARNLRIKSFQNQLADAQHEISNLAHENRLLRTLHKRQDNALAKYESTNAELPRLLNSHSEEIRIWQTKCRAVQVLNKELEAKIKQREAQILTLTDQNRQYSQLIKDKNLDERVRLQDKLRNLEQRLHDKDNDMKLMARKVQLDAKNFKQQLLNEQKKTKEALLKLEKSKLEISGYRKLEELTLGNKTPHSRRSKKGIIDVEPGNIEKIEKSLETLEKAIEKNNQSEFVVLTDGCLDNDYDLFDEDVQDEIHSPQSDGFMETKLKRSESKLSRLDLDSKLVRSDFNSKLNHTDLETKSARNKRTNRITLPPAQPHIKPSSSSKSVLGLALANKSRDKGNSLKGAGRLRSGGTESRESDTMSKYSMDSKSGRKNTPSIKSLGLKSANLSTDYSTSFDFDEDDDIEAKSLEGHSEDDADNKSRMDMAAYAAYVDTEEHEHHVDDAIYNGSIVDVVDAEDEDDDEDHDNDSVIMNTNVCTATMKEDISSIRRQISDDYKEREAFLDTFCRQASVSNMRSKTVPKKHINGGRKTQLLAALKAIDDNKIQD